MAFPQVKLPGKKIDRSKLPLAVCALAFGLIGLVTVLLSHADTGIPVGNPYIDPVAQTLPINKKTSFYNMSWRSYMETMPATTILNGMGVNYNPVHDTVAQDDANLQYLASIGVKAIRIELPWANVSPTDETKLTPSATTKFNGIFAACKKYGITPTLLLNANHGAPNPVYPTKVATIVGSPQPTDKQITVTGVQASDITVHQPNTTMGGSGITNGDGFRAGMLITNVVTNPNGSLTLSLSQPLDNTNISSGTVKIDYLKYMPLYPPGSPELNNTLAGWLQYTKTATNTVEAAGITDYSVEIWNELSFGSGFVSINLYYGPDKFYTPTSDSERPGGPMWQLADTSTQYLKSTRGSHVKVIWGFSNTSFFHEPSSLLPNNTDGETYHPYGTNLFNPKTSGEMTDTTIANLREGLYVPNIDMAIPETRYALDYRLEALLRGKLLPSKREATNPPGTTNFLHYITETGIDPAQDGVSTDQAKAQNIKAVTFLREYAFWLNKGLDQFDVFAAFDNRANDAGFNMLASGSDVSGSPVTPQAEVVHNFSNAFAGATTLSTPRSLGVNVTDITPNDNTPAYNVFPADPTTGEPALHYREMFQFLPFQVTNHKFVIPTYVMSWNQLTPPPAMNFEVNIANVNGNKATASYYDPITNTSQPITVASRSSNNIVLDIQSLDYPRLITIDDSGSGTPPPPTDTTPPNVSLTAPSTGSTASGASVSVSANASDNTGVAGVQFKLDGVNLGAEDTTAPYAIAWDSTKATNGSHTLTAVARDAAGNTSTSSNLIITVNNTPIDTTPPAAPANLTATATTATSISLSWKVSTDSGKPVAKYNVLRNGAVIAQPTGTSYTDNGRTANTPYSYVVQAVDAAGNVSSNSNIANVTTPAIPDTTPPAPPTGLKATAAGPYQVNLSWNQSSDGGNGSGIAGYNVYRDGNKINTGLVTTTSYGDTALTSGTAYSYKIEAVDGAGNKSIQTAAASATTIRFLRGDVTGPNGVPDGQISLQDVSFEIRNYNTSNAVADINGPNGQPDGKVDIYDISYIIRNYGQ